MRRSFSSTWTSTCSASGITEHARGAGVHAALRLGHRHPLHAVHAALELEQGVRRVAGLGRALRLHRDGDRLVAAEVGLGGVQHLGRPALPVGVPGVHAQQVAGEQRRLLAALAGLHLDDGVLVVGRVAGYEQPAQPFGELLAVRDHPLGLGGEVGVVGPQLAGGLDVAGRLLPLPPGGHDGGQLGVPLVELLRQPRVGVRLRLGQLALELGVLVDQRAHGLEHGDFSRWSGGDK